MALLTSLRVWDLSDGMSVGILLIQITATFKRAFVNSMIKYASLVHFDVLSSSSNYMWMFLLITTDAWFKTFLAVRCAICQPVSFDCFVNYGWFISCGALEMFLLFEMCKVGSYCCSLRRKTFFIGLGAAFKLQRNNKSKNYNGFQFTDFQMNICSNSVRTRVLSMHKLWTNLVVTIYLDIKSTAWIFIKQSVCCC